MTAAQLAAFVGIYRVDDWGDITMRVANDGDRLLVEYPDGDTGVLRPESAIMFFDPADFDTVDFQFDEATGAVTGFDWRGTVIPKVDAAGSAPPFE